MKQINWLLLLNQSCIPKINPVWVCSVTFFILYCLIQFADILFRNFVPMFMSESTCDFLGSVFSHFAVKIMPASYCELRVISFFCSMGEFLHKIKGIICFLNV